MSSTKMAAASAVVVVTFLVVLHMAPVARCSLKDIVLYQTNDEDEAKDGAVAAGSGEEMREEMRGEEQVLALTSSPRLPPPMTVYRRVQDKLLCRADRQVDTWLRHPANCSRHFVCSGGQVSICRL